MKERAWPANVRWLSENCANCGNLSLCTFPLFPPWLSQPPAPPSSEQRVHLPAPRRPVLMTFHGHLREPTGLNERIGYPLRSLGIDALRVYLPPNGLARR